MPERYRVPGTSIVRGGLTVRVFEIESVDRFVSFYGQFLSSYRQVSFSSLPSLVKTP